MKNSIKTYLTLLLVFGSQQAISQNTDHLFGYEVSAFKELQSQVNTEVIIIKSSRNRVVIQGDTLCRSSFDVKEEEGRLAIYFKENTSLNPPTRIVIETSDMNSLVSGGTGSYYLVGINQKSFTLLNPSASVFVSGTIDEIFLDSETGHTDLSELKTNNEWITISEEASFVKSRSSEKGLFARNTKREK